MFRKAYCTSGKGGAGGKTAKPASTVKNTGARTPVSNVRKTAVPKVTNKKNAPTSRVR